MNPIEAFLWTIAAGVLTVGGAVAFAQAMDARRRRIAQTAQTRVDQARNSAPPTRPGVRRSDEHPLPGVPGPGKRLRRSESQNPIDAFAVNAGALWAVPAPEPDHGPALVEYRDWLLGAHSIAAAHAEQLSTALARNPERDDARWCLLHQAIGRTSAYRTALGRLPDGPDSIQVLHAHLDIAGYRPDDPPIWQVVYEPTGAVYAELPEAEAKAAAARLSDAGPVIARPKPVDDR